MSGLYRSGLSLPTEATMAAESGCSGHFETSAFQALSAGKICIFATMASASGALNRIGRSIFGGSAERAQSGEEKNADHATRAKTNVQSDTRMSVIQVALQDQ